MNQQSRLANSAKNRLPAIFVLFGFLVTIGNAAPPEPAKSEYFTTKGGGFAINGEDKEKNVHYGVSVKIRKKLPTDCVVVFKFENPLDPKSPLIKEIQDIGEDVIAAKSPPVWGLKPNNTYLFAVLIYKSEKKQTVLAVHKQKILFGMSDEIYEQFLMPWYEDHKE